MKIVLRHNKKGIALLMVGILLVMAVPLTFVLLNMGSSQKTQALNFENILKLEQVAISGINNGFSRLMKPSFQPYVNYKAEVSGNDRYDLNITPSGEGFFSQYIYLVLSKAKDKDAKHNSILMADAEQFVGNGDTSNVISHDYWATGEPYELGVLADLISMRNQRGKDQLRYLDIKAFEMSMDKDKYEDEMRKILTKLPDELKSVQEDIIKQLLNTKIEEDSD